MNLSQSFSYTRSETFPTRFEYTATMYRNSGLGSAQDGEVYCSDEKTAQLVIDEWNALSQKFHINADDGIVWKYTLKGTEK